MHLKYILRAVSTRGCDLPYRTRSDNKLFPCSQKQCSRSMKGNLGVKGTSTVTKPPKGWGKKMERK